MEIGLKEGNIIQRKPVIYQKIDGKRVEVEGKFKILTQKFKAPNSQLAYSFEVASYKKDYPLIIDPVIVYSTYLGGWSSGVGIAVDTSGNAYVTGHVNGGGFPTVSPIQGCWRNEWGYCSGWAIFVTKIDATGSHHVYSTYLGGSGDDFGSGIAIDSFGNAYITGHTYSSDFPMASPIQGTNAGGLDTVVAKIDATGSHLVYSTYLGGSGNDYSNGIAVDTSGNAFITGSTASPDFPTASALYATHAGGTYDAFVTKIDAFGSNLIYSSYLGGSGDDYSDGIAVDTYGNTFITGSTASPDFPTASALYATHAGGTYDAFVTKIDISGSSLMYSTYIGGSSDDYSRGIALDNIGNAYITGSTSSADFPTAFPIQGNKAEDSDVFVTKLNALGSDLIYSTYLGGSWYDIGYGIAVDTFGNAYVTGGTGSPDFPVTFPIQGSVREDSDVFVTKINASGSDIVYSTYLGGTSYDWGLGIAVDASESAYITGDLMSYNYPTVNPIHGYGGPNNAFLTKIRKNSSPNCSEAMASISLIWPPNREMEPISILNVSDPDNDPLSITVTGISQDEPVKGIGSTNTSPDGSGIGTDTSSVRAERTGGGNGRVYQISFTANDSKESGTCSGSVRVCVPHNGDGSCIDDGQIYNSTLP